jgi:hypothetical protein
MFFQDVGDVLVFREPERVIQCTNEKRLNRLSFRIFLHMEDDRKAIRPLQNHLGDFEQRIGTPGHANLARERFDAFVVWKQRNANVGQRRRRFTTLALVALVTWTASAAKSFAAEAITAFLTALRWTGRPTITAIWPAWAFATPTFAGRASAIRARAAAVVATALGAILAAFVFGVKICRSWLLRPCGQEQLFQVQLVFRWGAH